MTGAFHFFDLPATAKHNIILFQLVILQNHYGTGVAKYNAEVQQFVNLLHMY